MTVRRPNPGDAAPDAVPEDEDVDVDEGGGARALMETVTEVVPGL